MGTVSVSTQLSNPQELCGSPAAPVTSVAISRCGNFGVVGSASGRLDRYNLQSGAHRGAYHRTRAQAPPPGQQQQQANGRGKRAGAQRLEAGIRHFLASRRC